MRARGLARAFAICFVAPWVCTRNAMRGSLLLFVAACSASMPPRLMDQPADAGDFGPYPAAHPAPPTVIKGTGAVIASPKIVPIFYRSDTMNQILETFYSALPKATYWATVTSEYGVGPLSLLPTVVIDQDAPMSIVDSDIGVLLENFLDGTHPEWPLPDGNTIYVIHFPTGTTITGSGTSCKDYGAFHTFASVGPKPFPYAVIPRCGGLDSATSSISHELVEAATDPIHPRAFGLIDDDHAIWGFLQAGAEVGDLCQRDEQANQPLVANFVVQRSWSNASAMAGHDPCVPALAHPYFNSAPRLDEDVMLEIEGTTIRTKGVSVPLGQSKTIDVILFSDAPLSNWQVTAADASRLFGSASKELSLAWDRKVGHNGDVLHLTITRLQNGKIGGSPIAFLSAAGPDSHWWFGFIGN